MPRNQTENINTRCKCLQVVGCSAVALSFPRVGKSADAVFQTLEQSAASAGERKCRWAKISPMKELYWKQFGGGPDEALLKKMDPNRTIGDENPAKAERNKKRQRTRTE